MSLRGLVSTYLSLSLHHPKGKRVLEMCFFYLQGGGMFYWPRLLSNEEHAIFPIYEPIFFFGWKEPFYMQEEMEIVLYFTNCMQNTAIRFQCKK